MAMMPSVREAEEQSMMPEEQMQPQMGMPQWKQQQIL
jgi:hypothetical protein